MSSVFKDLRFVLLACILVASVAMILAPYYLDFGFVRVSDVHPDSKCDIKEGSQISGIFGFAMDDVTSFERALENVRKGDYVTMVVDSKPFGCEAAGDRYLGFDVQEEKTKTLQFGIDIEGGTRVLLKPTETVNKQQMAETIKTLENRINFYGLKEVKINTLGSDIIQIEMAGATGDDIREFLSKQGKFAAKLTYVVRFSGGKASFKILNRTYEMRLNGDNLVFDGKEYMTNDTLIVDNETFRLVATNNNTALFYIDVFTGDDITNVLTDSQNSGTRAVGGGYYEFSFGIQVSKDGADRFAKLTRGQPVTKVSGADRYIESRMLLFLDDKQITDLGIGSSIAGQSVTRAVITGNENGFDAASKEKLRLESTLRSGKLPVRLEIEKVDTITQNAGKDLINSTVFVALASIVAVGLVVVYRYRDYKIILPMILISLSEIVIVVGMATSQTLAAAVILAAVIIGVWKREVIGVVGWITLLVMLMVASTVAISTWTIDIPVIAGLIAILGTGVNQMIIMTDQLFKEKGKTLLDRHKSAMNIIWSSAAIVVFAMIPLILGGVGALKGFAIATIVGVLVGILVTRPAYAAIIERAKRVSLENV
jgi:preprotein translocase subunit SecD